jgi:glycosyltransferase involved in cell wall biosynthesis
MEPLAVSVVMPCLNEAASVGVCVDEASDTLARAGLAYEVVVVDNGSTDGSAEIAGDHGARVVSENRPGYGSALRAGIAAARAPIVVMADADFTYDFTKILLLVNPVLDGAADLVVGERLDAATRKSMPFLHRFVGTPVLSFLVRRACGELAVSDSQSGFRAFDREKVLALGLRSSGMEFASEMLIRSAGADLRVREIHTGYRERIGDSKLNTLSDGWRHLHLILLLAPQLLLVYPGAFLLVIGTMLTIATLVSPSGLTLGSLQWQPVFFSGIALVLGLQGLIAGMVLANRSAVVTASVRRRYRFVASPRFVFWCLVIGAGAVLAGLVIDGSLFYVFYVSNDQGLSRAPALSSLAQSLLIVGTSLAAFAIVYGLLARGAGVGIGQRSVDGPTQG